jgi:hypothetical protein
MGVPVKGQKTSDGAKRQTSDVISLDIRSLSAQGLLLPGTSMTWPLSVHRDVLSYMGLEVTGQTLILHYRPPGAHESAEQWVEMTTTACHLGGRRYWFSCPGCSQRVAVLYAPGNRFACRRCSGLAYASQKLHTGSRASSQVNRLRRQLGWQVGILNEPGGKPKGMHWRTYRRLKAAHDVMMLVALEELGCKLDSMKRLM